MNTIFSFSLSPNGARQTVMLPAHCRILSAGVQGTDLVIWVLHNTEHPLMPYEIAVCSTGGFAVEESDNISWQFIDTVQMPYGLVWHVFVKIDFDELTRLAEVAV